MQVTDHFDDSEFAQPARHGYGRILYPGEWIPGRLRLLCEQLEVIRAALGGRPIDVISGYRSPGYNRKIGGAKNSQHIQGKAADIVVIGVPAMAVHETVLNLYFDKAIKIGGLGLYDGFVHVDVRDGSRLARWTGKRSAEETG